MATETLNTQKGADPNRLNSLLRKIGDSNSKTRPAQMDSALSYILSKPLIAIESVEILTQKQDKGSRQILEWLSDPERTADFIAKNGKTAGKSDFKEMFAYLETPASPLIQSMLTGHLNQPTRELKKRKDIEGQKKLAQKATQIGLDFAQALYETESDEARRLALESLLIHLQTTPYEENSLVDFLMATSTSGPTERNEAAKADAARLYFHAIFKKEFQINILAGYPVLNIVPELSEARPLGLGYGIQMPNSDKKPDLTKIWGRSNRRNIHAYEKTLNKSSEQIIDYLHTANEKEDVLIVDLPDPLLFDFALEPYVDYLATIGESFKKQYGHDFMIIPSPQGRLVFVSGPPWEIRNSKKIRPEIEAIVRRHVSTTDSDNFRHIHQEEVNSVLEFMRPFDLDSKRIAKELPRLIEEAEGGLHAISAKGIKSAIRLEKESFLRTMGLNEIFFRQEKDGIRVITRWNNGYFTFLIARDYQTRGLNQLSETNKDWLLTIVFSYLKAIKNRGAEKVRFINEEEEPQETVVDESTDEKKEPIKQISRDPYLRVLPLGYMSHEIGVDEFDAEVRFHYGISLGDLNTFFIAIQQDQSQLTNQKSPVNQALNKLPHGQSIRILIENIFNRSTKKVSQPRWRSVEADGKKLIQFRPTNPPADYDPETQFYPITFVRETLRKDAQPREVDCPGVAEKIMEIAQKKPNPLSGLQRVFTAQ
ncbi:hypothetical protein M1328_03525 [Patescibacteria group bacterium]|nr:hypothetical protein [Patescibacteria group bacterium]